MSDYRKCNTKKCFNQASAGDKYCPKCRARHDAHDHRKQEFIRLYQSGLAAETVGKQYGVSYNTVFRALRAAGIQPRRPQDYDLRTDTTKELQRRTRALKRLGFSYQEIADQFHVSRQRIQQLLKPNKAERQAILARANGRCESCGAKPKKLDLHHDTYDGPPTRALCTACHRAIASPRSRTSNRSQWKAEIKAQHPELFESIMRSN